TVLGVWWVQAGSARLWRRGADSLIVAFRVVVLVALPPSWDWATSGLENGLSVGWLGAVMFILAAVVERDAAELSTRRLVAFGVVLGLGPLGRPDLTSMSVTAVLAVLVVARLRGAHLVGFLVGCLAL